MKTNTHNSKNTCPTQLSSQRTKNSSLSLSVDVSVVVTVQSGGGKSNIELKEKSRNNKRWKQESNKAAKNKKTKEGMKCSVTLNRNRRDSWRKQLKKK